MYTSTNTFNSYRVVAPLLLHSHAIASFTVVLLSAAVVPSLLHNTYQFSSCLALSTFLLQWIITFSAFQRFFNWPKDCKHDFYNSDRCEGGAATLSC